MSMSKKDFIALADMLITARMNGDGREFGSDTHGFNPFKQEHIDFLADWCQTRNPRFMRDRWLGYIAGTNGKNGGKVSS